MTSTNKQYVGPTFAGTIDVSPTTPVFNLPTVNVVRGGLVGAGSIAALNIIGPFAAVIDATTLVSGQQLLLLASGGVAATVALSNGGTVAGFLNFALKPGNFVTVTFDGTNLS
jgi:Na+-translocating ferredoxin:NAD+ oxidoreductase RnfE subunit